MTDIYVVLDHDRFGDDTCLIGAKLSLPKAVKLRADYAKNNCAIDSDTYELALADKQPNLGIFGHRLEIVLIQDSE